MLAVEQMTKSNRAKSSANDRPPMLLNGKVEQCVEVRVMGGRVRGLKGEKRLCNDKERGDCCNDPPHHPDTNSMVRTYRNISRPMHMYERPTVYSESVLLYVLHSFKLNSSEFIHNCMYSSGM